uniref:Uncharacterized protein n=1 Tax=Sphaerodactylus townsendi TaxID=933632 RepID=A0ACB8FEP4_9SAUR
MNGGGATPYGAKFGNTPPRAPHPGGTNGGIRSGSSIGAGAAGVRGTPPGPAGEAAGLVLESELGQAELDLVLDLDLELGPPLIEQAELVLGQELELGPGPGPGPVEQAEWVLVLGQVPVGQVGLVPVLVQAGLVPGQLALWLFQLREEGLLGEPGQGLLADVDECQNVSLCGTHANCHNLPGSFQCICDQGYESARDGQHCLDVNECETLRGVCGTAPCENVEGSFLCICPGAAEEFDPTTRRCLRPPGAAARPPAFPRRPEAPLSEPHPSGASDGSRRECYYDPNAAQACENVLAWNATRQECCCSLGHGWGLDCHVQECPPFGSAEFQTLCPHGSGFAAAAAGPGFAASTAADVDECSLFSSQVCKGGVCVNQVPSYSCYCPSGYYYETQHLECIDNDECQDEEAEPCLGGHCINTIGSYYCSCAPPLVLDASQHRCVANDSQDANLAMCWQEVGPDLVCSRPRLDRQVTYTECCCLYGEAWSMDCALCPAQDSEDLEALCNILRPPSYGPGRPPGLGLPFEYGGREFVPYGPEIFAPPVRPVPRLPDYDPYLRDSLYGPSPYEASDFEDPSYGDLLQDGRYPARGPPEPEWLYPLGGSSSSRSGGSFSERPGRASEDYRHSEEFGAPHAEECGILSGCDNGRCVRVADGFTCLCHEGYRLDPTRMACLDIDECIEVEGLCLGGECFNMDGFYRCLCPRGMVPTGQPPRCVISAPHSQG